MSRSTFSIVKNVRECLVDVAGVNPGDTLLVGVSGGADSVALLHMLANLPGLSLQLVVAHLNHCLRGDESDDDEAFINELGHQWGLQTVTARINVRGISAEQRMSIEEAGREARYSFLHAEAKKVSARYIVLAHHADDQAETVLIRLLRGSGTDGLSAMRQLSANGRYVRPLLNIRRTEIHGYLEHFGINWREDSTNAESHYLRNRIRHELIPLLRTYNPAIVESLNVTAETSAADEAVLLCMTENTFSSLGTVVNDGTVHLDRKGVAKEESGVRMRLYRHAMRLVKGDLRGISYRHLQAIDTVVIGDGANKRVTLPSGLECVCSYGDISITVNSTSDRLQGFELIINNAGSYVVNVDSELIVSVTENSRNCSSNDLMIDLNLFPFPWTVRSFKQGDRIVPKWMTGRKKVKDYFIDKKIPLGRRRLIPLLFVGNELLWIAGHCQSEHACKRSEKPFLVALSYTTL